MIDFFLKVCKNNFISLGCGGSLLLRGLFSSCNEWGLFFIVACGFLIPVASPIAAHGL